MSPPRRPFRLPAALTLASACLVLAACPAGAPATAPPPASPATESGTPASPLAAQIAARRPSLLAGVTARSDVKSIMKEVSRSLGVECDYCHDVSDFSAPTPNRTIAGYMYTHFSREMTVKGGAPLTCAHCHDGKARFLGERADKDRIGRYMQAEYCEKLQRTDGTDVRCRACHVKGIDQPFLPR